MVRVNSPCYGRLSLSVSCSIPPPPKVHLCEHTRCNLIEYWIAAQTVDTSEKDEIQLGELVVLNWSNNLIAQIKSNNCKEKHICLNTQSCLLYQTNYGGIS